jgi:hypothetical protein
MKAAFISGNVASQNILGDHPNMPSACSSHACKSISSATFFCLSLSKLESSNPALVFSVEGLFFGHHLLSEK